MALQFRKCSLSDLDELICIAKETFVDAFEKDNDPEDFKNYIKIAFEKNHIKAQLSNNDSIFYFVYEEDDLVGYFKLNENSTQTDLKKPDSMELERIYVLSDFQGRKIGEEIMRKTIEIAKQKEKTFLWLGVWEKNLGAIRFYEKHGFTKFGTHPYYIGKDKQTDWLMRFDLTTFPQD